ncbi:MAG: FmdB family zinc ribbon protein [Candidatus Tumulicola sp.]
MPLYDYKCTQCGKISEVRHGFDDSHADACPACGGALTRVFNPAPIVFKGSGFYVTDSRKARAPGAATPSEAPAADGAGATKPDAAKTESPKTDAASAGAPSTSPAKGEPKASEPAA